MAKHQVIGVIPARWESSRFPGKPLADISGKSLIQRTYENAVKASTPDKIVIATDDQRIADHVAGFGASVVMTDKECPTGTDRVYQAINAHFPNASIIVNIQGDEPCLNPKVIDQLVEALLLNEERVLTTPVTKIFVPEDICAPHIVKCVFDRYGKALYFSRAPIPFPMNQKKIHDHYRHLGVYCFRRAFLETYCNLKSSMLQDTEDLEQLKVLEAGYPIHVCVVKEESVGVDTPEDIEKVKELLERCQESTYSSPVA